MSISSYFEIEKRGSTVGREVVGGISTFMAMSYIIFVQPALLSLCPTGGMGAGAVMVATCVCSALACLVMGLWANLPVGLAPAMGHNVFFVFTACGLVGMGGFGLAVIGVLLALEFRGAILLGIMITAGAGYFATRSWGAEWGYELTGHVEAGAFPNVSGTAGKFAGGLTTLWGKGMSHVVLVIFTFLLLDMFDTVGTLMGLSERAGLMKNGQLPRAKEAMMADAIGTISGTMMGTSTITSYVESSAGIAAGARTGLAAVVTGCLFVLSLVGYPLLKLFGQAVVVPAGLLGAPVDGTVTCYPVVAPVLIVIGCYMVPVIRKVDWDDFSEALPAFLCVVIMQFSMSITDGIAWGMISYCVLKLFSGKGKGVPLTVYICAVVFVLYYVLK